MYLEDLVSQEMYKRVIVLEIYFRVSNKKISKQIDVIINENNLNITKDLTF